MTEELPLYDRVGFNYAQALRDLLKKLTYADIAQRVGYNSTGSLTEILGRGRSPSHRHGEAIWALYLEVFGKKPPLTIQENARQDSAAAV